MIVGNEILLYVYINACRTIGNGHARETFLATMSTGERVTAKTADQRQIQVEFILQPLYSRTTVERQNFG